MKKSLYGYRLLNGVGNLMPVDTDKAEVVSSMPCDLPPRPLCLETGFKKRRTGISRSAQISETGISWEPQPTQDHGVCSRVLRELLALWRHSLLSLKGNGDWGRASKGDRKTNVHLSSERERRLIQGSTCWWVYEATKKIQSVSFLRCILEEWGTVVKLKQEAETVPK